MKCERCGGSGYVLCEVPLNRDYAAMPNTLFKAAIMRPCESCIGGIAHCCDGLCAQPEPEKSDDNRS